MVGRQSCRKEKDLCLIWKGKPWPVRKAPQDNCLISLFKMVQDRDPQFYKCLLKGYKKSWLWSDAFVRGLGHHRRIKCYIWSNYNCTPQKSLSKADAWCSATEWSVDSERATCHFKFLNLSTCGFFWALLLFLKQFTHRTYTLNKYHVALMSNVKKKKITTCKTQ